MNTHSIENAGNGTFCMWYFSKISQPLYFFVQTFQDCLSDRNRPAEVGNNSGQYAEHSVADLGVFAFIWFGGSTLWLMGNLRAKY